MELNLPLDPLTMEVTIAQWPADHLLMVSEFGGYCGSCVRNAHGGVRSALSGQTYGTLPKAIHKDDAPEDWCIRCGAALRTPVR